MQFPLLTEQLPAVPPVLGTPPEPAPPVPAAPPLAGWPPAPPLPAQNVEGTHTFVPLGCPLILRSEQHPVVQPPFVAQTGAHVPTALPKLTQ